MAISETARCGVWTNRNNLHLPAEGRNTHLPTCCCSSGLYEAEAISKELLHTFSLTLKQIWHPKNAQIHCSQPWWTHGPLAVLKWTQPQRKPMSLQVLGEDGSPRQLQIIHPVWKPPTYNRRILSLQRSQIFWWRGRSSHHSSTTHPVWA